MLGRSADGQWPGLCSCTSSGGAHAQHTGRGPVLGIVAASISVLCHFSLPLVLKGPLVSVEVHASANMYLPASFLTSFANPTCSLALWVDAIPVWCDTSLQFVSAQALYCVLL